tara:strand:- start:406 stop:630 length:225 start_codon:yes stop_codon:yes gene_type:complete
MIKIIQGIITKGLVIYLITIAICFKAWDIYTIHNENHFNYVCNKKGQLFKSATPSSKVFVKQQHEMCLNGENYD